MIGITAALVFIFCVIALKEPADAFAKEYHLSSVDRELMANAETEAA